MLDEHDDYLASHGGDLPADATNAGPGQRDAGEAQAKLAESSLR